MGEVFKPEDVGRKREKEIPDLGPGTIRKPATPANLGDLLREVRELRAEVERIKRTLKERGIFL